MPDINLNQFPTSFQSSAHLLQIQSTMIYLKSIWQHNLHQRFNNHAIIHKDTIIVPEKSSYLSRIHPETGEIVWKAKLQNTWGWLEVTEQFCFGLSQHDFLQAFDIESGEQIWSLDLGDMIFGYLVASRTHLLVGGWRGYSDVIALEINSGKKAWRLPYKDKHIYKPLFLNGLFFVVSSTDKTLELLSECGDVIDSISLPGNTPEPDNTSLLNASDNSIMMCTDDGRYWRLPFESKKWELLFHHEHGISTICPAIRQNLIIFIDEKQYLQVYDINGHHRWNHNRNDILPVELTTNKQLAIGSSMGRLALFDHGGTLLSSQRVGKRTEALSISSKGTLVIGTQGTLIGMKQLPKLRLV